MIDAGVSWSGKQRAMAPQLFRNRRIVGNLMCRRKMLGLLLLVKIEVSRKSLNLPPSPYFTDATTPLDRCLVNSYYVVTRCYEKLFRFWGLLLLLLLPTYAPMAPCHGAPSTSGYEKSFQCFRPVVPTLRPQTGAGP